MTDTQHLKIYSKLTQLKFLDIERLSAKGYGLRIKFELKQHARCVEDGGKGAHTFFLSLG